MTLPSGVATGRLTLDLSLEIDRQHYAQLHDFQPRISARIVSLIREQDASDLHSVREQARFRRQLLEEAQRADTPVPIIDVVIRRLVIL